MRARLVLVTAFVISSVGLPGASVSARAPGTYRAQSVSGGQGQGAATTSAGDDSYSVRGEAPLLVAAPGVLANDTGTNLTAVGSTDPAGSLELEADGSFIYVAPPGPGTTDSFTYQACAAEGCDEATVSITIDRQNAPPQPGSDQFSVLEDEQLSVPAPGLLLNDVDPDGDDLSVQQVSAAQRGWLMVTWDGGLEYEPYANVSGQEVLSYRVCDLAGACATAYVTIVIEPVNDPPHASDDLAQTEQYTPVTIEVLANDDDLDSAIELSSVGQPSYGTVHIRPGGVIEFTPDASFKDGDAFTYSISDGAGGTSTATVRVREIGCGEDGISGVTPVQGAAPISGAVDRVVEPAVGTVSPPAAEQVHDLNCDTIVPAEQRIE